MNQLDVTSYSRNDSDSEVETDVFSQMGLEPILHPSCAQTRATPVFSGDSFCAPIRKLSGMKAKHYVSSHRLRLARGNGAVAEAIR